MLAESARVAISFYHSYICSRCYYTIAFLHTYLSSLLSLCTIMDAFDNMFARMQLRMQREMAAVAHLKNAVVKNLTDNKFKDTTVMPYNVVSCLKRTRDGKEEIVTVSFTFLQGATPVKIRVGPGGDVFDSDCDFAPDGRLGDLAAAIMTRISKYMLEHKEPLVAIEIVRAIGEKPMDNSWNLLDTPENSEAEEDDEDADPEPESEPEPEPVEAGPPGGLAFQDQKQEPDDSELVDISGLDKLEVVRALWTHSRPALFFADNKVDPPSFDKAQAERILASDRPYFDYLCGRVMKTNFSGSQLCPRLYNRDNGIGAMQKVVAALRAQQH